MNKPKQLHLAHLLSTIDQKLFEVLESLSETDWNRQTIAPKWTIKDIAVHLLDGNLRTLSMLRDNYYGEQAPSDSSYEGMVNYLNELNADWVNATRRLSPSVIIDLLKQSGLQYTTYLTSLDPNEVATFSVAWAGESQSKNWFHIAREYTEKWHHQQQIRSAIGEERELLHDQYYHPYLDTSVRGLPHHYRDVIGQVKDVIKFVFTGNSKNVWYLRFTQKWELLIDTELQPNCEVIIEDSTAWRIFTKGISREEAIKKSTVIGKRDIGLKIFDMTAVMA